VIDIGRKIQHRSRRDRDIRPADKPIRPGELPINRRRAGDVAAHQAQVRQVLVSDQGERSSAVANEASSGDLAFILKPRIA
jgi:hypothetical protein